MDVSDASIANAIRDIRLKYRCPEDDPVFGVLEAQAFLSKTLTTKVEKLVNESFKRVEAQIGARTEKCGETFHWRRRSFHTGLLLIATLSGFGLAKLHVYASRNELKIVPAATKKAGFQTFVVSANRPIRAYTKDGELYLDLHE